MDGAAVTATTDYLLTEPLPLQPGEAPGTFSVTNRDATHVVLVDVVADKGTESCRLARAGDSVSFGALGVRSIVVHTEDETYPARIMLVDSNLDFDLQAAPILGNDATTPIPVINV
jgi:hypothetical protein